MEARQQEARTAAEEVFAAERQLEATRRHAMHLLTLAGNARNHTAQAEESLAALEREAERLMRRWARRATSRKIWASRADRRSCALSPRPKRSSGWKSEIAALRESLQASARRKTRSARAPTSCAASRPRVAGRRDSLEALIRNHSYSTDTVRRLLKPGALAPGMAPVGTLADFLEVSGAHEAVVDEFLREELNYVVVESWVAAEQGVRLLKSGVDGRATFLIHPAEQGALFEEDEDPISGPGLTPLKDAIRVLNGFGRSLESILPKLRNGYLVEDSGEAHAAGLAIRARLLPHARGRVLPQRHGDRRQAGQRRPAGAEARAARDRKPPGQTGDRRGAGGERSRRAHQRHRGADRATGSAAARSAARRRPTPPTRARR